MKWATRSCISVKAISVFGPRVVAAFTSIDPRGVDLQQWCDLTTLQLQQFGTPQRLDDVTKWKDWAAHAVQIASARGVFLSNPYQFTDWKDWASDFNQYMDSIT